MITYPGPVIGIQARGLSGRERPHPSIEAMADEYVKEVKSRQPYGPYYLCGYSFGGLVAFEMARRLRAAGDEVGLVGLFDTMMSPIRWPLRTWLSILRRRIVQFGAGVGAVARIRERLQGYRATSVLKVAASALIASARYRPQFYPGELTLFTPVNRDPGLPSPQAIWSKHAGAISIVETAGAHMTMLAMPNAESTAAALTRVLSR
jgi:thioesterase domain-containing protein